MPGGAARARLSSMMGSQSALFETIVVLVATTLMLLSGLGKRRLERRSQPRRLSELLRRRARAR